MDLDSALENIMAIAEVPAPRQAEAWQWLRNALELAETLPRAQDQRLPATKHNDYLADVERAVVNLDNALTALREQGHVHSSFWNSRAFGPVRSGEIERSAVVAILRSIQLAAVEAREEPKGGRPPRLDLRNMIGLVAAFFERFSQHQPSSTAGGPFLAAVGLAHEYSVGREPPKDIAWHVKGALRARRSTNNPC